MQAKITFVLCFIFISTLLIAQRKDTIEITPNLINTKVLREGTHRYLVYFKKSKDGPRTDTQYWTRTISRKFKDQKPVLHVNQVWEYKDTTVHTVSSLCDAATMQPITHEFWWKRTGSVVVDFTNSTITRNGKLINESDTSKQLKALYSAFQSAAQHYSLNWHLDMEVFPTLPYRQGVTFLIPFYDPGTTAPFQKVAYTVTGSATLEGYNEQKIDCWLLVHESKGNREVFWVSKRTGEVLKLEQEINGSLYRYKIKLGFSV